MRKYLYFLTPLVLFSCAEESVVPEVILDDTEYFPLEIGKHIDYQVDEIIYSNEGRQRDSSSYFLRESIVDSFVDDNGVTTFLVDRLIKSSKDEDWMYQQTWVAGVFNNEAIRIENNLTFVKLQLPPVRENTWNGNKYFDDEIMVDVGPEQVSFFKNWQSQYVELNTAVDIKDLSFPDVHIVQLANEENKLELRWGYEQYASGIGLIQKELMILDTQCFDMCNSWEEKAEKGIIYRQYIIDYN